MLGETVAEVPQNKVPGFLPPAVEGQVGIIRSIRIGTTDRMALFVGSRTHLYEGKGVRQVVHGVRTAAAAGCRAIVLTNGCGGLREEWGPGTPVLISDHINLTATSPLEGPTFVDLTDLYAMRLREIARQVDPSLAEGVYVAVPRPQYETPAEVRMARAFGGDLVGMSTTLEAIAAREAGMEVLGISLVTNLAAGISKEPLGHTEVMEAGRVAAPGSDACWPTSSKGSDRAGRRRRSRRADRTRRLRRPGRTRSRGARTRLGQGRRCRHRRRGRHRGAVPPGWLRRGRPFGVRRGRDVVRDRARHPCASDPQRARSDAVRTGDPDGICEQQPCGGVRATCADRVTVDTRPRPDTFYGVGKVAARHCAASTSTGTSSR